MKLLQFMVTGDLSILQVPSSMVSMRCRIQNHQMKCEFYIFLTYIVVLFRLLLSGLFLPHLSKWGKYFPVFSICIMCSKQKHEIWKKNVKIHSLKLEFHLICFAE